MLVIQVCSKSKDKCPYKSQKRRHRYTEDSVDSVYRTVSKECIESPELEGAKKDSFLRPPEREDGSSHTLISDYYLQNCERTTFCLW